MLYCVGGDVKPCSLTHAWYSDLVSNQSDTHIPDYVKTSKFQAFYHNSEIHSL